MIRSYDINVILVPFDNIAKILATKGIDFNWEEKEKEKAMLAWKKYDQLSHKEKIDIAIQMVDLIKDQLFDCLRQLLDNTLLRELQAVIIEILTNKGEIKKYRFENRDQAIEFLEKFSLEDELDESMKELIKTAIPDLITETPATPIAIAKYKKGIKCAGDILKNSMRQLLIDVVSETVKKSLFQ